MPKIIASHGVKGGVGKSMLIKALTDFFLESGIDAALFETDRSNPDFMRAFKKYGCRYAVFSESEKMMDSANQIFNSGTLKTTLVNLPAQVHIPLKNWFEQNEILEIAKEEGVSFCFLWVSNGGFDSLKLFQKSVDTFKDSIQHVFIKNWGLCDDWQAFEEKESIQSLITQYDIPVVDFPKLLGSVERAVIDEQGLTFREACRYEGFGSISRQRVRKFLREAFAAFEQLQLF